MLKRDLNNLFIGNNKNPQSQNEVSLFRAFINVMNKRHFACAREYHGSKGHVKHMLQFAHNTPRERCCEIADVLMLFIDERGNMRFTFLQNKRDTKTQYNFSSPLRRLKADSVQWDLLHYRCNLSDPLLTGLPKNCLSSAVLNSAASYGIFVNDANSTDVDMSYNIARDLFPATLRRISNRTKRTFDIFTNYNRVNLINGYWEIEGTATLDDFETAAQAMLVGSPIEFGNPEHLYFAKNALSYAYTRLVRQRYEREGEGAHESFFPLIRQCADRYEIDLSPETYLPYNLIVMKAKNKYFASSYGLCGEKEFGCKPIIETDEIHEKLIDENSIVFVDSNIMSSSLERLIKMKDINKCYVVVPDDGGVLLVDSKQYLLDNELD